MTVPQKRKEGDAFAAAEQSAVFVDGHPQNAYEIVHKYGTYNNQPTADSDNEFPEIAQGLPKAKKHKEVEPESVE